MNKKILLTSIVTALTLVSASWSLSGALAARDHSPALQAVSSETAEADAQEPLSTMGEDGGLLFQKIGPGRYRLNGTGTEITIVNSEPSAAH